jgi:post-segregation antitoxin (ccd killing protein)
MKTEVYSWRLSGDLKSNLEREARQRKLPMSALLESAVQDLLRKSESSTPEEEKQRKLHEAVARCMGVLGSGASRRAETAREAVRTRLRKRHGR